jgi:hypothetical protein
LIIKLGGGNEVLNFGDQLMKSGADIMMGAATMSTALGKNTEQLKDATEGGAGTAGIVQTTKSGGTTITSHIGQGIGGAQDSTASNTAATASNTEEIAKKTEVQSKLLLDIATKMGKLVDQAIANDLKPAPQSSPAAVVQNQARQAISAATGGNYYAGLAGGGVSGGVK